MLITSVIQRQLSVNQMISPFLRLKSPVNHLRPAVVDQIWKIRGSIDLIVSWRGNGVDRSYIYMERRVN